VGESVGAPVGLSVGRDVGAEVGFSDGTAVGATVGIVVGLAVGVSVGFTVGASVGMAVGDTVGPTVGFADGERVGSAVGTAVGAVVTGHQSLWLDRITSRVTLRSELARLSSKKPSYSSSLGKASAVNSCWFRKIKKLTPTWSVLSV
jgi:hypothetical protein